jgi:hypothetical protein
MLPVVPVHDRRQLQFSTVEIYIADELIVGDLKLATEPVMVVDGIYRRSTVLGRFTEATTTAAAVVAAINTTTLNANPGPGDRCDRPLRRRVSGAALSA